MVELDDLERRTHPLTAAVHLERVKRQAVSGDLQSQFDLYVFYRYGLTSNGQLLLGAHLLKYKEMDRLISAQHPSLIYSEPPIV
jgi:hypothetical protein